MILLHSFTRELNLTPITQALRHSNIAHRVRFLEQTQQLWLQDESQKETALSVCQLVFVDLDIETSSDLL
ncbi:MAG: hypothetical protein PSN46_00790 [Gammaproteobacteria bacterium]|nr:hypothetical protein [Gammaproteobacteria bacterium]